MSACIPPRYEIYNQLVCRTITSKDVTDFSSFQLSPSPELGFTGFRNDLASSPDQAWNSFSASEATDTAHSSAMGLTKDSRIDSDACRRNPAVQRAVAQLVLSLTISMGVIGALMTGIWYALYLTYSH
jgi:hypothetical protein